MEGSRGTAPAGLERMQQADGYDTFVSSRKDKLEKIQGK